ncbi:hypothetical protein [Photobacterium angustum]|uniref:hypothetical protein n=1 Tax=Photobacterium angustum TaxID=661 RepID=UPI0005DFEA99|nr:hypothetical protein [Photobacterium angustum]KJF95189.1 hypothetical protein UB39_07475 [Photobacterium angustum]PSW81117.1 hypothetical protein CTN03_08390 [Photobacterium angustum]
MGLEQQISSLVQASEKLTETVSNKIGEIDKRCDETLTSLELWKENVTAESIQGEGKYVNEITVKGDKDTLYPVYFSMPSGAQAEIQIYRAYHWNNSTKSKEEQSAFNATHVASALVVLRGQAHFWNGDANYLRTDVNFQRYRPTVGGIGHSGYAYRNKLTSNEASTEYSTEHTGFNGCSFSSFFLRGGNLTYSIISNREIDFRLMMDSGTEIYQSSSVNAVWTSVTLNVNTMNNDGNNNLGTTFIGKHT